MQTCLVMWAEWNNQVISLKGINFNNFSSYFSLYNCKRTDWNKLIKEKNSFIPSVIPLGSFACLKQILCRFSQCHTSGQTLGTLQQFPPFPNQWTLLRLLLLGEDLGSWSRIDRSVFRAGGGNSQFQPFPLPESCYFAHYILYLLPRESRSILGMKWKETLGEQLF